MAAGVCAVLLAGTLGYRAFSAGKAPRLFADAARDHFDEVTLQQHRTWRSDPKAIAELAQRRGIPPSLVSTILPLGYGLVEAKLCRLDGRVFLHLVYAHNKEQFSLYLRNSDTQPLPGPIRETTSGKPLHECDSGHQHIASFQTGRLTAMVVTDQSDADALAIARVAAQSLD